MQAFRQLLHREERRAQAVFGAQRADVEYPLRRFAQLDDATAVSLAGNKVQITHFCDGVTQEFVHCALRGLAAVEVGDGNTQHGCRGGYGEDLIAVSQHHQKVGTVGGEIISKGAHGRTGGLDHVSFIIPLP